MRDPLTERDYLEIRTAVMSEVRRRGPFGSAQGRRRRSAAWRYALVSVAIAIALLFLPRRHEERGGQAILPVRPRAIVAETLQPQPVQVRQAGLPVVHKPRKHHEVIQTASTEVTRIDIRTADPDVRIIWFARQEESK